MKGLTAVITRILEILLIVMMSAMVLDVLWQVFTRFVLKDPSSFSEELAGFLLIWIGLLGAVYALHKRSHLGIDILTRRLSGRRRVISEVMIYTVVILFAFFVMVIGGVRLVSLTLRLRQISPAMSIPMGYIYTVLPLSGILFIYYSAAGIVRTLTAGSAVSGDEDGPAQAGF